MNLLIVLSLRTVQFLCILGIVYLLTLLQFQVVYNDIFKRATSNYYNISDLYAYFTAYGCFWIYMRLDYGIAHDLGCSECLRPKFSINWLYYNGLNDIYLEKRNAYRKRIGMEEILDDGSYFSFTMSFGKYELFIMITFREVKYGL